MAQNVLVQSHVFGVNREVRNNVTYLDEQTILYPAGTQLVQYNVEQKVQKFLPVNEGDGITTLHISSGQAYAAVAVKSAEKGPFVIVMDVQNPRKRKILMPPEGIQSKVVSYSDYFAEANASLPQEIISVSFSNDSKHVLAQSGAPDWGLYYWSWEKTKLLATLKTSTNNTSEIHQMTCNPFDLSSTQVCLTGNSIFRIYRYQEGNFKLINQQKPDKNLLCHCWINDVRIVAGTDDSKILVFDSGDLILEISYVVPLTGTVQNRSPTIETVTSFAGGIIAGTSTGVCVLFERTDDNYLYKKNKEFLLEDSEVSCIALSPAEDMAVCTLGNSQIYLITMDADSSKGDEIKCDRLAQPFHNGNIVGMDTCARKPLIATCGADKSIRIWNYMENSIEVIKYFDDEPLSISLHPSGLYVLVGFADSLKLMNILIDDIRPFWESNIRGCRECRFSNGGQYFASVYGSTICIHSTWSFETIGNLKGHTGKVRSICWALDDSKLTSCGLDGNVIDWNINSLKKEAEVQCKNVLLSSVCYANDSKLIYAVGSDGVIKVRFIMSRSGKLLFAATTKGSVRAFKYPISLDQTTIDSFEVQCHSAPIARIRISYDDSHIFTCGEDGCLWIYKIQEKEQRGMKREKDWVFSDEILVTKSDLKDNQKLMIELRQRVEALKSENETQLKLKDLNYNEKLKELTDKYMTEIEGLKQLTSALQGDREQNEKNHKQELSLAKSTNQSEIEEIQNSFNVKIAAESEKFAELTTKMTQLKSAWEKQIEDTEQFHSSRMSQITDFYRKRVQEKNDEIIQLRSQFTRQVKDYEVHLVEIEEDANDEILQIGYSFESKLKAERESLSAIKEENLAMRSRFEKLTAEIEENKGGLNKMFTEERRLHGIIKGLEKDIIGVKREMQERDDTIQDKEKRIYDLKKKNQELEKFKFVLDYKIAELKKQVEPREKDIILLSNQIKEMDDELHQYQKRHDLLDTTIQDLMLKLKATETEAGVEQSRVKDIKTIVRRIQNDVQGLHRDVDDINSLKRHLISIFHKYSNASEPIVGKTAEPSRAKKRLMKLNDEHMENSNNGGDALEEEMEEARQREHLERTVATLKHKIEKGEESKYAENLRIMQENVMLLSEINILRKDFEASRMRANKLTREYESHAHTGLPYEELNLALTSKKGKQTEKLLGGKANPLILPPL
ncbi:Cilia- and flagella-associated protein 57 [Phlyctochytrium planicorne]|nr:Cilia- and flagella-associated protein 57 [Phlyctochytrium planicorne]